MRPVLEIADILRRHGPAWRAARAGHAHGLRCRPEQHVVDLSLVAQGDVGEFGGNAEDDVEIANRQQVGFTRGLPFARLRTFTIGRVPHCGPSSIWTTASSPSRGCISAVGRAAAPRAPARKALISMVSPVGLEPTATRLKVIR